MNRILTFCLLMLCSGIISAKQIGLDKAKQLATNFVNQQSNRSIVLNTNPIYRSQASASSQSKETIDYFYVFSFVHEKGFVMISADDQALPILGYSFESTFEVNRIPEHVAKWLESYKSQIRYIIAKNIPQNEEIKSQWEKLESNQSIANVSSKTMAGPLMSTTWNQSPYYNALCPYDNSYGERTVSGCVATAMTQIMKYHNHPAQGTGSHSYNHSKYGTLSANFGATTYNWSAMPNDVSSSNSAVATLTYQVGVSVNMDYNVSSEGGSGAYVISSGSPVTNCSEYALKTYFGYKSSLSGKERENYSDATWISMMKTEINASRPVLYAGYGSGGGHCFVLDGYDNSNNLHFNWGWGGSYDGFFNLNALNPGGVGIGGGTGGFNSNHQAVIGIEPNSSSSASANLKLYASITPSANPITFGAGFSVTANFINSGTASFSGDIGAFIYDGANNYVGTVETKTGLSLGTGMVYSNNLTFTSTGISAMLPGNYTIGLYYKPTGGQWIACGDYNGNTNFEPISVENTGSPSNSMQMYSNINVTPNPIIQGQSISINADVVNNGSSTFDGDFSMDIHSADGSWLKAVEEKTGLSLASGYHYTNGLTFTNSDPILTPGTYYIAMWYKPNGGSWTMVSESGSYSNPIQITVVAPGVATDPYEVNNNAANAYQFPLSFSGNQASFTSAGSNFHSGSDYDYYKVSLASGYYYTIDARIHDSYNSGNGNSYTVDAQFSWSDNGSSWSDAYDDIPPSSFVVNGGTDLYFFVSPYFTGKTGTYLLDVSMTRTLGVAVDEKIENHGVIIFPNPTSGRLLIDCSEANFKAEEIAILDLTGKTLLTKSADSNRTELNITDLPTGMYQVKVSGAGSYMVKKIVKN